MKKHLFLIAFCGALLAGCSSTASSKTSGSQARDLPLKLPGIAPNSDIIHVDRRKYTKIVSAQGELNEIRMVPIFKGKGAPPRYRLFGIRKGSVYDLLGLKNRDVLIAADDYIIYEPRKFTQYLFLLRSQKKASIRIDRRGYEVALNYVFE